MELIFRAGLAETDDTVAIFPLAAFAEQINSFEALEDAAFTKGTGRTRFETVVL